jgi:Ca-activated chloride channel homolog
MRVHRFTSLQFRTTSPEQDQNRRGAMLPLLVITLPLFFATAAFSVDVAYMHLTRTQLRRATDAAVRAAADSLLREQDTVLASDAAKALASVNPVAGQPLILEDADIVFGRSERQEDGTWQFVADAEPLNSVRINSRHNVPLIFGPVLGVHEFEPVQSATAARLDRDLMVVVDRSTSMKWRTDESTVNLNIRDPRINQPPHLSDSRWADLVAAVEEFNIVLDQVGTSEQVGLASYGGSSSIWPSGSNTYATTSDINQPLTLDHDRVRQAMALITSKIFNGYTNISAGIDEGIEGLTDQSRARPHAFKTMVLMTDGIWNKGRSPQSAAQDAAAQGIVIHTVTFSDEANQSDMQAVAQITGGQHFHAPDGATLREAFREIARALPVMIVE